MAADNLFISVKGTKIPMPVPDEPVIKAVTPEQYAALSEDEIKNGVYFVSDAAGTPNE